MSEETPEAEEFHPYVRLLLARMKSNPDDFFYEGNIVPVASEVYFTEAEKAAVWAVRREIVLGRNHEKLMEQILKVNEPKEHKHSIKERYSPTQLYRDAYLAQSQQGYRDAYLAQSQQGYGDARLSMPTVANGGTGTTVTAELIKKP